MQIKICLFMTVLAIMVSTMSNASPNLDCDCPVGGYFRPGLEEYGNAQAKCKRNPLKGDTTNIHKYVPNCGVYGHDGYISSCITCKEGYYMNQSNVCVANGIQDCAVQTDANTCTRCNASKFISQGVCDGQINETVEFCLGYSADGICSQCEKDYGLNTDTSKTCVPKTTIDKCLKYTYNAQGITICQECQLNVYNENSSFDDNYYASQDGSECVKYKVIQYCESYFYEDSKPRCSECRFEYGLDTTDNLTCRPMPFEVRNCEIFSFNVQGNYVECEQCAPGYYPFDQDCVEETENPNSATYENNNCKLYEVKTNDSADTQCKQCQGDFYIKNGDCVAITGSQIQSCEIYLDNGISTTTCAKCMFDNLLSDDASECLDPSPKVGQCITYSQINGVFICEECKKDRQIWLSKSANECKDEPTSGKYFVTNCIQYLDDADGNPQCQQCEKWMFFVESTHKCEYYISNSLIDDDTYSWDGSSFAYECIENAYLTAEDSECDQCPVYELDGQNQEEEEEEEETESENGGENEGETEDDDENENENGDPTVEESDPEDDNIEGVILHFVKISMIIVGLVILV